MKITTKQFQLLSDINLVWDFLVETYDRENDSGRAAPFFEYALRSSWMDSSYTFLNRFWFDGDKVVAFVFYEAPVTDIYFNVRKGYEFLADELIDYAITSMPHFGGEQQFILFDGQQFLKDAAAKRGFKQVYEYEDLVFDFKNDLNYELPAGYHFVEQKDVDIVKCSKLCWYGFGHGERGEFKDWDVPAKNEGRSPFELYQNVLGATIAPAPHATYEYTTIIADENDDYVCFSGMWWNPETKLAYMEPLCTVPEHQHKGLAGAALSHHDSILRPLGAEIMTGGGNEFYKKIGYQYTRVYKHYIKK